MSEMPSSPDIDPSVDAFLEGVVKDMTSGSAPSKQFSDETVIPKPSHGGLQSGETVEQMHKRLQQERGQQ